MVLERIRRSGHRTLSLFPLTLARLGLVSRERGQETFDIATPAMVSGGIWTILRLSDFFMVSLAGSDAALAAMQFAFQYYFLGFALAMAIGSGTISVVSRFKGREDHDRADLAIKQALWLSIGISAPLVLVSVVYPAALIELFTDDPAVVRLGGIYLQIIMMALTLRFWSMIGARALEACGNTRTPMVVNLVVIPTNFVLNAILIFGLGPAPEMGIAGAAAGTALATALGAAIYVWIFRSGLFEVQLRLGGTQVDRGIIKEIVRVGLPVAGRRLIETGSRFPFLFVLGVLGTPVVAAFAIGRRFMTLALIPGFGYATAASALVGQNLGRGDEEEATRYGREALTLALVTQVLVAGLAAIFARPIVVLFNLEAVDLSVTFIRVLAVSVAGNSVAQALQGALRGAGDMTWPFYAAVLGNGVRLTLAALALPAGFVLFGGTALAIAPGIGAGVVFIYAAIILDRYLRAVVVAVRFWSGRWKVIGQKGIPTGTPEEF